MTISRKRSVTVTDGTRFGLPKRQRRPGLPRTALKSALFTYALHLDMEESKEMNFDGIVDHSQALGIPASGWRCAPVRASVLRKWATSEDRRTRRTMLDPTHLAGPLLALMACLAPDPAPLWALNLSGDLTSKHHAAEWCSGVVIVEAGEAPITAAGGHAAPFVADFDGDGVPDLAVGEYTGGRCRLYRNLGTAAEPRFKDYVYLLAEDEHASMESG